MVLTMITKFPRALTLVPAPEGRLGHVKHTKALVILQVQRGLGHKYLALLQEQGDLKHVILTNP